MLPYVWLLPGDPPQWFLDYIAAQDYGSPRRQQLVAAITRLRAIESAARTNAGLRADVAWSPPQQRAILDALADVTQTVRWLVQQQVAAQDPAD
jgi:hypothetical protein